MQKVIYYTFLLLDVDVVCRNSIFKLPPPVRKELSPYLHCKLMSIRKIILSGQCLATSLKTTALNCHCGKRQGLEEGGLINTP